MRQTGVARRCDAGEGAVFLRRGTVIRERGKVVTTMLNFIVIVGALTIFARLLKDLSLIKLLTRWHRLDGNKRFEQNCELVFPKDEDEEDEFEEGRR